MSAHKSIDRICIVIAAFTVLLTVLFCNGQVFGIETTAHAIGYENRLFDRSRVHTLDIVIGDWDSFLQTCESEEYSPCAVVIDGEAVRNVGIRGKGNTSLSSVRNSGSSRYSFKIEFDQYEKGKTYHGLDKLCLNNIIQDNTYMKDYLAYSLMYDFGVDAPLCSYAYITVNGEDWGLYLAVEAIEDSFLNRNYGSGYGDLYKPDAMGFGGGRGNGKDFRMSEFMGQDGDSENAGQSEQKQNRRGGRTDSGADMPDFGNMPDFDPENMPENFDPSEMFRKQGEMPDFGKQGGPGGFGMGSSDVKLQYTDDAVSSYSNIFSNAKTIVTEADQKRLIASLKALSEKTDLESTVDTDEVLRYFVVHLFLQNGDSYTGQMIHNYYLYEQDGQLSMIPWDYNLAYGSFMGGNASSAVNAPIDTPVSGDMSDRPMVAWIFESEEYTAQYHRLFSEFLDSTDIEKMISDTAAMIDAYVQKDPTKFCTYEAYQKGVAALGTFCKLRAESVRGQLDGTIPATSEGQKSDSSALIDTAGLNISDMGTMGGGNMFGKRSRTDASEKTESAAPEEARTTASAMTFSSLQSIRPAAAAGRPAPGGQMPQGFDPNNMPEGFDPNNMPQGFDPNNMPEGFDPNNMPQDFNPDNQPQEYAPDDAQQGQAPESKPDEKTVQSKDDSTENAASGRPQPGSAFPGMPDGQTNQTAAYILVGLSVLVLLLGLGFALRFKR